MASNLAIVIPAKNEQAAIVNIISDIHERLDVKVLVVNDGSEDDTAAMLNDLAVHTLHHCESLGAWLATQTGLIWAYNNGYDYVVTMDADGQHLSSEIEKLLDVVKQEPDTDVVVGACVDRASFHKKFLWFCFRKITGIKVKDITSGFRLYNRKALEVLISQNASLLEYQDVGVLLLVQSSGLKIGETAVKMDKRFDGKSRIFSSSLKIFYYIATTLIISFSKRKKSKK